MRTARPRKRHRASTTGIDEHGLQYMMMMMMMIVVWKRGRHMKQTICTISCTLALWVVRMILDNLG